MRDFYGENGDILGPFRTLTVSTGYQTLRVWLISWGRSATAENKSFVPEAQTKSGARAPAPARIGEIGGGDERRGGIALSLKGLAIGFHHDDLGFRGQMIRVVDDGV